MGLFGPSRAKKLERKAAAQGRKLDNMLANRQAVINPYSGVSDLSSMITNPFANLQIATQATQLQAEQTDIALASTLDTLRATGSGAGGATALARAAAASKQGISAQIEAQEIANQQVAAEGESMAMQMRLAEAQRMQEADIFGKTFMFQAQEQRDVADLSRLSAQQQQYLQLATDMRAANKALVGDVIQAGAQVGAAFASDRKLKKDIKLIGKSRSGLNIYEFSYIDSDRFGKGVYQGVMSDEAPSKAVVSNGSYDSVDYSKIDVQFKRIR